MINIELNDMLVFEDESGNMYQDCVVYIKDLTCCIKVECNNFILQVNKDTNEILTIAGHSIYIKDKDIYAGYKDDCKLKEVWHKTDEDTYKKVWDKIKEEEKLTGKNLLKTYKIFKEQEFKELETYNNYTILKASLNPHNSEYVIKELGFDVRFSSLSDCKKYIKFYIGKVWSISKDGLISMHDYKNDIYLEGYKEGFDQLDKYCEDKSKAISEEFINLFKETKE